MSDGITESIVEQAALEWLDGLGYEVLSGLAIAPGEATAERADYKQVFSFRPAANQAGGFGDSHQEEKISTRPDRYGCSRAWTRSPLFPGAWAKETIPFSAVTPK
jgi:hypothetical protein